MSEVNIPDLTGKELKPGYGIPYQPTKHKDFQEQAEGARVLKSDAVNWQTPSVIIIALMTLALLVRLILKAKRPPQP